jgi:two-component system nitrate/nitrite response regulator NarL
MSSELPDIPGVECTCRLKRLVPEIHIVMCSSRTSFHDVSHALASGASGYLVAPAADDEIIDAVKRGEIGVPFLSNRAVAAIVKGLQDSGSRLCSSSLSIREHQVMLCLLAGKSDKAIADSLNISTNTARVHMRHLLRKMQAHCRTEAIQRYLGFPPHNNPGTARV